MRLKATAAGLEPILEARQLPAAPARRTWLKRLGAALTGTAVAAPALAGPRQVTSGSPYIGEIMLFAGNFAPFDWAFCDGSLLSIADNSALFSLLGTTYGGDGVNTFALPDLRGRAPRHFRQGPGLTNYALGQQTGSETRVLTSAQLPAHTHSLQANTVAASGSPVGNVPAALAGTDVNGETVGVLGYGPGPATAAAQASTIQATGTGAAFNLMPTSLVMNYCIALYGIYPSTI